MNNKAKIIISILSVVIILVIAGLSIFLVLTATIGNISASNLVVNYDGSDIAVDVKVTAEYYDATFSIDGSSVNKVVETKADFTISPYTTDGTTKSIDLGNIDFVKYTTSHTYVLKFAISLNKNYGTPTSVNVKLQYNDTDTLDSNVRMQCSGLFTNNYSAGSFNSYITNGGTAWSATTATSTAKIYSTTAVPKNYSSITYTVTLSPYSSSANSALSGNFVISLSAAV